MLCLCKCEMPCLHLMFILLFSHCLSAAEEVRNMDGNIIVAYDICRFGWWDFREKLEIRINPDETFC
jgi:hypothetical protein